MAGRKQRRGSSLAECCKRGHTGHLHAQTAAEVAMHGVRDLRQPLLRANLVRLTVSETAHPPLLSQDALPVMPCCQGNLPYTV